MGVGGCPHFRHFESQLDKKQGPWQKDFLKEFLALVYIV